MAVAHRRAALVLGALGLCGGLAVVACGSESGSTFNDNPGGGGFGDAGFDATTSPGLDPQLGGSAPVCSSGLLCGASSACCAAGQDCFEGACVAACASGTRCGGGCCETGQVCLSNACVAPGKACGDSFDCEETEFCEPTLSKCLPQPTGANACEYRPPTLPLAPKVEWSWTGSTILPTYDQVIAMPVVLDTDKDGIPEVFVVTSDNTMPNGFPQNGRGVLRRLDGRTGAELWTDPTLDVYTNLVNPRATAAAADLEGDGKIAIVVGRSGGGLLAFNTDGSLRWRTTLGDGGAYNNTFGSNNSVTVAIADMNNDGKAEIVAGSCIFDSKGVLVRCLGPNNRGGSNADQYGPVSIIADLDGDDSTTDQHLVTGNAVYRLDGSTVWALTAAEFPDGYPAVADLDRDGTPELVVVSRSNLRVHNALTGALLARFYLTAAGQSDGSNFGGPPTIADFDGDGRMDIATAGGYGYFVFGYDAMKPAWSGGYGDGGPLGVLDAGAGPSTTGRLLLKWFKTTQDISSNVTGSSVFDFEGDGKAEVVYQDECHARVYRGTDGETLYEVPNSSATIFEYPVLVDVDGDNNTEFVVVANDYMHKLGSPKCYQDAGDAGAAMLRHGVFVYGDANDKWVRTRRVWNQHAYHLTNINADGTLPRPEARSFAAGENNNYRVSSQGKGAFNAPDLRVDLSVSTAPCPAGLELRARVSNAGTLGVKAGVPVSFYAGNDASGRLLAERTTSRALLPGESELVTYVVSSTDAAGAAGFFAVVNGAAAGGAPAASVNECLADNNGQRAGVTRCPGVN